MSSKLLLTALATACSVTAAAQVKQAIASAPLVKQTNVDVMLNKVKFNNRYPNLFHQRSNTGSRLAVPDASKTSKAGFQRLFTTPDGAEIWGNVVFAEGWTNYNYPVGVYSFSALPNINLASEQVNGYLYANGGGSFYNNKFHFVHYNTNSFTGVTAYYYEYDTDTWQQSDAQDVGDLSCIATEVDYDDESGLTYGSFYDSQVQKLQIGAMDYEKHTRYNVGDIDLFLVGVAIDKDGQMYGIDLQGDLYKIDKRTAAYEKVGATGVKPGQYEQSATFDKRTGRLYWAAVTDKETSALYEVDVNTGAATKISDFPHNEGITCLYVPDPGVQETAPAKILDLATNFEQGSTTGKVSFTAPTTTFGGAALTGSLTYYVYAGNKKLATGSVSAGQHLDVDVTAPKGSVNFVVTTENASGESPKAKSRTYIGYDKPYAPGDVKLAIDETGSTLTVTWTAPRANGINGGYIGNLVYDVVRYPDEKKVASNTTELSYTENVPKTTQQAYYYAIYAKNAEKTSEAGYSNAITTGQANEVPYLEPFNDESSLNVFTFVNQTDAYGYENGFDYSAGFHCLQGAYSSSVDADHWVFTPAIRLEANRYYRYSMKVNQLIDGDVSTVDVTLGKSAAVDGVVKTLMPDVQITKQGFNEVSVQFMVDEPGSYYFGIHNTTPAGSFRPYIDDIAVNPGTELSAPDSVTDLKVVAGARGAKSATLTFKAPTVTVDQSALKAITKIDIFRNDTLVNTINHPEPGQAFTWTDENIGLDGVNHYSVTAVNTVGDGLTAEASVFIGVDIPAAPKNVRLTESGSKLSLTWQNPGNVGAHGGYVADADFKFNVYDRSGSVKKADVDGESYDITDVDLDGHQSLVLFGVSSKSATAESDIANSNAIIVGRPQTLPYTESFTNGVLQNEVWWLERSGKNGWGVANDDAASDNDLGYATFAAARAGDEAALNSGKITLMGAANPRLVFDFFAFPGHDLVLKVGALKPDGTAVTIKTIDYKTLIGDQGWRQEMIDLSSLINEDYVMLRFDAVINDKNAVAAIDNINLADMLEYNLSAAVTAPEEVTMGKEATATVTVKNSGERRVEKYTVNLYLNDKLVGTKDVKDVLASFEAAKYDFTFPVAITDKTNGELKAEVVYDYDLDTDDNVAYAPVSIIENDLAKPVNLTAEASTQGVSLTWSAISGGVKSVTDGFDTYDDFSTTNVGDWTLLDGDGEKHPYGSLAGNFTGNKDPYAFVVYNHSQTNKKSATAFAPHSGEKSMLAISTDNSDDYLISPALSGKSQTVTFWGKAIGYNDESVELLYSTTDKKAGSFQMVSGGNFTLSDSWEEFSAQIPEGAKFFAIHYISKDTYGILIDDVTFETGTPAPTAYNVYRDGERIAAVTGGTATYVDATATEGQHTYNVTAVFDEGESGFSNTATVNVATGVDAVAAGALYVGTATGTIVIKNADTTIRVFDMGGQLVYTSGERHADIPVRQGTYLVTVGTKIFKLVVN